MIKLDFSKGDQEAHSELIRAFIGVLLNKTKRIKNSTEYKMTKKRKLITIGEIDISAKIGNNLILFEIKTNNDLKGAIRCLKNHQKNIHLILEQLDTKLSQNISKITYIAVVYELYLVYELSEEVKILCSIDEFIEQLPL